MWGDGSCRLERRRSSAEIEGAALAGLAALATVLTLVALSVTAVGFLGRIPVGSGLFGWCERVGDTVPLWLGVPSAAVLLAGIWGAIGVSRRHLRVRSRRGSPGVVVVDSEELFAYSLGGHPGQVVTSRGLLEILTPAERVVIFAHETAHVELRHHRLLWLADIAALNPLMRPLRRRLRFALERSADEVAVRRVRDRNLVASTISRVALLSLRSEPKTALRIDGSGVVGRVEALLSPAAVSRPYDAMASAVGVISVASILAWSQWPHLTELVSHLCHV